MFSENKFNQLCSLEAQLERRAHERMSAYFHKRYANQPDQLRYLDGWRFSQISDNGQRKALAYIYGDGNDLLYLPIACLWDDNPALLESIR